MIGRGHEHLDVGADHLRPPRSRRAASAAGLTDSIVPRSSMVMMPSSVASRIARCRASLSRRAVSARLRSVMSRAMVEAP